MKPFDLKFISVYICLVCHFLTYLSNNAELCLVENELLYLNSLCNEGLFMNNYLCILKGSKVKASLLFLVNNKIKLKCVSVPKDQSNQILNFSNVCFLFLVVVQFCLQSKICNNNNNNNTGNIYFILFVFSCTKVQLCQPT